MPDTYDHITLMCRLKAAQRRNKELESGERYIQLEELHQKEYNVYEHKIEKLKKELADAHTDRFFMGIRYLRLQCLDLMFIGSALLLVEFVQLNIPFTGFQFFIFCLCGFQPTYK